MEFFMANRTWIMIMWFGTLSFIAHFITGFTAASVSTIIGAGFVCWGAKRTMERFKGVNHAE